MSVQTGGRRQSKANGREVSRPPLRTTLAIHGAREHNLKNVSLEIPRDQLVVITGLSGSGKSSLAFDTIYAEGQRRYMESLSSFAKRFIAQVTKPDVDFMFGLSPVISIEQRTTGRNPRSTVGTMTDIASYLNLLFATISRAHCPCCRAPETEVPVWTRNQILEQLMALPVDSVVELRAPVFPIYGEDYNFLFAEIRKKGYRRMLIDGNEIDLSEEQEIDDSRPHQMAVVIDKLIIRPGIERHILNAISNALLAGDQMIGVEIVKTARRTVADDFYAKFGCRKHHIAVGDLWPEYFMFNNPAAACRTCMGLGVYMQVHEDLLVPDTKRSIREGCFVREAYHYEPDSWGGYLMFSLAKHFAFSLDKPWRELPERARKMVLYGAPEKFPLVKPDDAKGIGNAGYVRHLGRPMGYDGIARWAERRYKRYRQQQVVHSGMEAYLEKVMVEHRCPDCGGRRLKSTRMNFTIDGKTIYDIGEINFAELQGFMQSIKPMGRQKDAGRQILREINGRLDLLLGIGLDYMNFNRKSATLSGGESQRIRLSTQIGSGLMGMLYVLDEPSIGLHPKDNQKMIATLRRLRDLGNTVIVVEHDEDTIRAADHIVELGPGPGVHGGQVVVQGTLDDIIACNKSLTGRYLSHDLWIRTPDTRRRGNGKKLIVRGARENNLQSIDVQFPLGSFICVTGASGSGKSTLVNDVLYKALWKKLVDTRTLPGEHDRLEGVEHISSVVNIDQSPIGRSSRSNPATYIGFYDDIRTLFAETPEAKKRGYAPGRFSFNVKTGRCPECSGEGTITTQLYFMPDVEVKCESCKGARYNPETLEVTYRGKTIADVLDMPIEEGEAFFEGHKAIGRKIHILNSLGLGYLTLGQSSTTLSGGEAQRIKLANELSKMRRGEHVLYILDEPTTGLHFADIAKLLECLSLLVEAGNTVLVIEHHPDVIKTADWIIDLGPEGGHRGGRIVVEGTPEMICRHAASHTGRFLKKHMEE